MGLTPLEGLMMGTRCGDIDPAIIPYLVRSQHMDIDQIDRMLNKESGLRGISGSNDMREVLAKAEEGDARSRLAVAMYVYRIKKYIGAYAAILGNVDAIVFTGGIGEHAAAIREIICAELSILGISINRERNRAALTKARSIETPESRIRLFVIPTDEELEIAIQTETVVKKHYDKNMDSNHRF